MKPFIIVASYVFTAGGTGASSFARGARSGTRCSRCASTSTTQVKKALLWLALAGDLGVLAYFKYYDFFVDSSQSMATIVGLDLPFSLKTIILPVGISFYTFMAISYVVDTYRGDFVPTTFEKFAVYLSFFPHLVAGPIVRGSSSQLDRPQPARWTRAALLPHRHRPLQRRS